MKKDLKRSNARVLLHECCDVIPVQAHVLNNLKTFVIKYVYGSKELGFAETEMKKKNMLPDEDTLNHICLCANYLAYFQKNFQLIRHPSPTGNGWAIINGKCRPVRID